jgi:hypothetical protein
VGGLLFLRRAEMRVSAKPADANGRALLTVPLAEDPALSGTTLHMQAAFRVGTALVFGPTLVEPLIL